MTRRLPTKAVYRDIENNQPVRRRYITEKYTRGDEAIFTLMNDDRIECTFDWHLVTSEWDDDDGVTDGE